MSPADILSTLRRLAAVALVALAAPAAAAAPCPQSCASNTFDGTVCSTSPTRDSNHSNSCAPNPGLVETHESWNLVTGAYRVSAKSCYFAPVNGFASVTVRDRFRLVGPVGGGPIAIGVKLVTSGSADGYGTVGAVLFGEGEGRSVADDGLGGFSTVLEITLPEHAIGDEFEIVIDLGASAQNIASAQGQLAFTGLPPGYGVTSCQGYAGEGAVTTRRTTWSAIKRFYR